MEDGVKKQYLSAGIFEEYWDKAIDSYVAVDKEVIKVIREYMANLPRAMEHGISLFMHGSNGTGKSGLSIEILKQALREGYSAQVASVGGIIQVFSGGWYSEEMKEQYETRIKNVDFLLIDDVGKEYKPKSGNDLTMVVFENMARYRTFRNKPILMTTNEDIDSIEGDFGKSVVSLIYGKFIPLRMAGEDFRKTITGEVLIKKLVGKK